MEKKTYHYKKGLIRNGGITCPICSDIQNPNGQSKFVMIKVGFDDKEVECHICGTKIIFDK